MSASVGGFLLLVIIVLTYLLCNALKKREEERSSVESGAKEKAGEAKNSGELMVTNPLKRAHGVDLEKDEGDGGEKRRGGSERLKNEHHEEADRRRDTNNIWDASGDVAYEQRQQSWEQEHLPRKSSLKMNKSLSWKIQEKPFAAMEPFHQDAQFRNPLSSSSSRPLVQASSAETPKGGQQNSHGSSFRAPPTSPSLPSHDKLYDSPILNPLPSGWVHRDPNEHGRSFFDYPEKKHTQWDPPTWNDLKKLKALPHVSATAAKYAAEQWKEGEGELPPQWDYEQDSSSDIYFITPSGMSTRDDPRVDYEYYESQFAEAERRGVNLKEFYSHGHHHVLGGASHVSSRF